MNKKEDISQAVKARIFKEELYRHQIRIQLEDKSDETRRKKLWQILNSAFFLWFLSSVILGLFTYMYTRWEKRRDEERTKAEQVNAIVRENRIIQGKLDAEIASRLGYVESLTTNQLEYDNRVFSWPISQDVILKALISLEKPADADYSVNVFPEYASRSLRSLLWELLQVMPIETQEERDEKQKVTLAYERAQMFPTHYMRAKKFEKSEVGSQILSVQFFAIMKENFSLDRWGTPFKSLPEPTPVHIPDWESK